MTHTYIVAEIGQNHDGSVEKAKRLIDAVAGPITDHYTGEQLPGVDAIKLTKRDLAHEYTAEMRDSPYDSPHSYGRTYGEHREALELSCVELNDLSNYAVDVGLEFGLTLCGPRLLEKWPWADASWLKVASRDLDNGPLLSQLRDTGLPIIISTGMARWDDLSEALRILSGCDVTIMHCLSQYPANYKHLDMKRITRLKNLGYRVGFSDHTPDSWTAAVAVGMGAQVIEKHVTLSRLSKGTDHAASLEPARFKEMVARIRHVELSLGDGHRDRSEAYNAAAAKLRRSICTARDITAGETFDESNTELLSPGTGFRWSERDRVWGQRAVGDIPTQTLILPEHLTP